MTTASGFQQHRRCWHRGESVINKLYEYCNQGSSDSYASEQRNTIAESLKALKKTFYDEGNVDYAGRYVFTGYKTDTTLTYQSDALAAEADYTIHRSLAEMIFQARPSIPMRTAMQIF